MKPVYRRLTVRSWEEEYQLKRTGETRVRTKHEFKFERLNGKPLSPRDEKWLFTLKIPPAVNNVEVYVKGQEPQASWTDDVGRTQRLYSKKHRIAASNQKFAKVRNIDAPMKKLQAKVISDLNSAGVDGEAAAVLYTIFQTGFRIGEDKDTGAAVKAYGASQLENKHVQVSGNTVKFNFIGKKGVQQKHSIVDARLARIFRERKGSPGRLFTISAGAVRSYIDRTVGIDTLTPKDIRTWLATNLVKQELKRAKTSETKKEFKTRQREIADEVANKLGNTRAVSLSGYIDPNQWDKILPEDEDSWRPAALKE